MIACLIESVFFLCITFIIIYYLMHNVVIFLHFGLWSTIKPLNLEPLLRIMYCLPSHLVVDGEMWICKPTGMNQGKGIFILRSRQEIDNLLAERDAKNNNKNWGTRPPMMRIVQR